jgi:hypothetical protein
MAPTWRVVPTAQTQDITAADFLHIRGEYVDSA